MDFEIRGRIALVTGASAGIGEAVALALAREGVRLAVAARHVDRLEALAKRARESGASDGSASGASEVRMRGPGMTPRATASRSARSSSPCAMSRSTSQRLASGRRTTIRATLSPARRGSGLSGRRRPFS